MDYELLFSLCILWLSSTVCLFTCAFMFIFNNGEAFHPHSVDMERRHSLYQVVKSNTVCKYDFVVKSISEFISPRGSSSDKYFTVLIIMGAVSGFLGSVRWQSVGDASYLAASLSQAGFFFLVIVAMFEVDVSPAVFLEEKLMITTWFLEGLNLADQLNFPNSEYSPELLEMMTDSDELKHMYEEYDGKMKITHSYFNLNFSMHMLGASSYIVLVTAAVILSDLAELKVAFITGISFFCFGSLGYLTGSYFPVDPWTKGSILLWNPFLREKDFLLKLQVTVEKYKAKKERDLQLEAAASDVSPKNAEKGLKKRKSIVSSSPRRQSGRIAKQLGKVLPEVETEAEPQTDLSLNTDHDQSDPHSEGPLTLASSSYTEEMKLKQDSYLSTHFSVRQAYRHPQEYLLATSHIFMVVELIAFETPMIAMGIQWITALCGSTPPVNAFVDVFMVVFQCAVTKDFECKTLLDSCIIGISNATRNA